MREPFVLRSFPIEGTIATPNPIFSLGFGPRALAFPLDYRRLLFFLLGLFYRVYVATDWLHALVDVNLLLGDLCHLSLDERN